MTTWFKWDDDLRERLQWLYNSGYTWTKIAENIGCTVVQAQKEADRIGFERVRMNDTKESMTVTITEEILETFTAMAKAKGIARSHYIERLLRKEIKASGFIPPKSSG